MDCNTARLLCTFARPRNPELAADEAAALARHLAECPECQALQTAERAFDDRVGRAVRAVPVPANLQARILQRLGEQRRQVLRRRVVRCGAGLAAAVLLIVGWAYWPVSLIQLDLYALHDAANLPPSVRVERLKADQSDRLPLKFSRGNLKFEFPATLNYLKLTHHGVCELQGHRVPFMEFKNGKDTLRVYILDGQRFDLNAMSPTVLSGGVTLDLNVPPGSAFGWLYLYTGGSLEPFLSRDTLPAT